MKKCKYCSKKHQNNNIGCNNSGHDNSGNHNSGHDNSGNHNSGHYNSGHYNSGHCNSGDCNSGHYNSGHFNSGDFNSGHCNSGDCNSGNYNSGHYNSGNVNSGLFNTNEPKMRFFNKESDITYSEFRKDKFVYPDLKICAWVKNEDLKEEEKSEITAQMGGKLKTLSYKEAWKEYWSRASEEDKEWFQELPNFSEDIFKEITGIKVVQKETIKIGNNTYYKNEVEEALKNVKSL
jgi:hypothetical protein